MYSDHEPAKRLATGLDRVVADHQEAAVPIIVSAHISACAMGATLMKPQPYARLPGLVVAVEIMGVELHVLGSCHLAGRHVICETSGTVQPEPCWKYRREHRALDQVSLRLRKEHLRTRASVRLAQPVIEDRHND